MALVTSLLGEPDRIQRLRFGRFCYMFNLERVAQVELSAEFGKAQDAVAVRKAAARKAVQTKIARLNKQIAEIRLSVSAFDEDTLTCRAVDSYNFRNSAQGRDYIRATVDSDSDFLDRLKVNYLRHEMSPYEAALAHVHGKTGKEQALWEIRDRIYHEIAKAYPDLAIECARQIAARSK